MVRGLVNIGNTCSINSLLQCIASSTVLRRFLTEYPINVEYEGRWSLTAELAGLIKEMRQDGESNSIAPRQFLQAFFDKARFLRHGEQHDIGEVWMLLCDTVAKECFSRDVLKRYNVTVEEARIWRERYGSDYAKAVLQYSKTMKTLNKDTACMWLELVQGVLIAQVTCSFCKEIYHNFEPFTTLSLDIPHEGATIPECIGALFKEEKLNDWKCDKCSRVGNAEKTVRFWKLPAVLCVCLRRFVHNSDGSIVKNRAVVEVPDDINITCDTVVGPQRYTKPNNNNFKYKLTGIGLHHGCLSGGHYTALADNKWMDDDFVRSLPIQDILARDAYLMFYDVQQG